MAEENLSVDVYAQLSERILRWELPPGTRLTEEGLCAEFSVSRSPVREALGQLVVAGLVIKKARHGYSVRRIDLREINELYDVRLLLERSVVDRICRNGMAEARLNELEVVWRTWKLQLPELSPLAAQADEEFHELLALESGNAVLTKLLEDIDRRIHFVRLSDITNPARFEQTCSDHLEILASIRTRDSARALAALERNIEWGRKNVEAAFKDALARAYLAN